MKIHSQTNALLEAVSLVASVVSTNATRQVTRCIHFKASADGLIIQGTDLDVGLSAHIDEVMVEVEGSCLIEANKLQGILKEVSSDHLTLEVVKDGDSQVAKVSGDRSLFKLPLEVSEDFPTLSFSGADEKLELNREQFVLSLKRTATAAAKDATRYQMHSVLLDAKEDNLTLVSTDGKRMALCEMQFVEAPSENLKQQHIVPLKAVDMLIRVLSLEDEENISLHLSHEQVIYHSDRFSLACRLVEGRYPDYARAVPQHDEGNLYDFSCDDLTRALRQASLLTTKESNSVAFTFEGANLVLDTQGSQAGESRVEMQVDIIQSVENVLTIKFNPQYILEFVKVVAKPSVRGVFKNNRTAGMFYLSDEPNNFRYIVMPLAVS